MDISVIIPTCNRADVNYRTRYENYRFTLSACFAIAILLGSGYLYRCLSAKFTWKRAYVESAISSYPMVVNGWHGQDVAIPEILLRIAGNDDYIFRHYVNHDQ